MLLQTIKNEGLTVYHQAFDTWEEAIKAAAVPMIEKGFIDDQYVTAIIDCVHEYGPYIVLMEDVAMPHSTLGATGVYKNGIGFMKVEKAVDFDPNDSEKKARLFFTLAAVSHDEHLNNMMQLSELLMNEAIVADLLTVQNDSDLQKVIDKYQE